MIPVCYCGNKKVFPGLLLSALSLAEHASEPVHLYILSMDLHEQNPDFIPYSENQMQILNEVLRSKNPENSAELIDITDRYKEYLGKGANKKGAIYTPYTLLRLYLDELDMPDKLIYLDIDTMCTGDIKELYDVDVDGCEYGATLDYMGKFWIDKKHCNAGVLLLNLPEIRKTKLFERCRELLFEKRMAMLDQSALNKLVTKQVFLPDKFNEQRTIKPDTVVKHFNKGIKWYLFIPRVYNYKQWHRDKVQNWLKIHDFDDIYAEYDKLAEKYDLNK